MVPTIKKGTTMSNIKKLICKLFDLQPRQSLRPVHGITSDEYASMVNRLNEAYNEACSRQQPNSKKPSGYMKGLMEAMDIVASFETHFIGGI